MALILKLKRELLNRFDAFSGCFDTNFGAIGNLEFDCSTIHSINHCDTFDDEDFIAREMCCTCNGGHIVGTKICIIIYFLILSF